MSEMENIQVCVNFEGKGVHIKARQYMVNKWFYVQFPNSKSGAIWKWMNAKQDGNEEHNFPCFIQ